MKSAYELAMERFDSQPLAKITDEQKAAIGEIDRRFKAKIAEAELMCQERLKNAANDPDKCRQIRDDLVVELASLRERCEREKDRVRHGED